MTTHDSVPLRWRNYVFDPRPRFPFLIVAKRYWVGEPCGPNVNDHETFSKTRRDVRTLVFIHGSGCHKEHWEPTIQRLFEHERARTQTSVRFRDMWSLDLPNHGDSAILNEEVLRWGFDTFSWKTHARGIHTFLAGIGTGVDVDFSKRRLAIVGHCAGALEAILTSTFYPLLKITSLHLIAPSLLGDKAKKRASQEADALNKRHDVWPSPEEAFQALRTQPTFRDWDQRILKILVTHGLRPLPTGENLERMEGVTFKCTKKQQAASVFNSRYLPHVVKKIPTHIAYGDIMDTVPYELQHEALHVASGGSPSFASVITMPGVGHTVVQSHPDVVADVIWKQLSQSDASSGIMVAKL